MSMVSYGKCVCFASASGTYVVADFSEVMIVREDLVGRDFCVVIAVDVVPELRPVDTNDSILLLALRRDFSNIDFNTGRLVAMIPRESSKDEKMPSGTPA